MRKPTWSNVRHAERRAKVVALRARRRLRFVNVSFRVTVDEGVGLEYVKRVLVLLLEESGATIRDMASVAVSEGGPAPRGHDNHPCASGTCDYCTLTNPPEEPA